MKAMRPCNNLKAIDSFSNLDHSHDNKIIRFYKSGRTKRIAKLMLFPMIIKRVVH
jgi:hypothetical protein